MQSMEQSRRAAGTRTMPDVIRNLYRPPTPAQKAADLEYLATGWTLKVAALLVSAKKNSGVHWIPQGYLYLSRDMLIWKGSHHPELPFAKGEWIARPPPPDNRWTKSSLISLVSNNDHSIHYEQRIPTPDVDLVVAAFS